MVGPKKRFTKDDGSSYPDLQQVPFGDIVKPFTEKSTIENEDILLSSAINGMFLNTELFGHQRGASNKGYKKIRRNTLVLSAQNLHLGNANVNQRFDHGIISPAYNTYDIVGCNPDFMAHWVKRDATKRFFYNATTPGASQCRRNVDWDALYEQTFYLPCEEEQQKIADFLSSVDEVIAACEAEEQNLEMQKKAVMKKIFSQEVRFKKEDGTDFPEWEEKRLEEVVEFLDGMRKPIETSERVPGQYPYYGASGITDYVESYIFDEDLILLSEDGANILDRNYRVCFMARGKYWVNNHAHVLRANADCVNEYICEYLESLDYSRMNSGSAQPKLNQQTCRKILVKKPCFDEQRLIAEFLSDFDEAITAAKKELELWKEMKKGLLQQMFV